MQVVIVLYVRAIFVDSVIPPSYARIVGESDSVDLALQLPADDAEPSQPGRETSVAGFFSRQSRWV